VVPGPVPDPLYRSPSRLLQARTLEQFLGLGRKAASASRGQGLGQGEPSQGEVVAERIREWGGLPGGRSLRIPRALVLPAMVARDGLAFAAAYQAGSPWAMGAVAGISLTCGALRQGIGYLQRAAAPRSPVAVDVRTLAPRQLDILLAVWANDPALVNGVYLHVPGVWSYRGLCRELDALVRAGLLERRGRSTHAVYTAAVSPGDVLRSLAAGDVAEDRSADMIRVAQAIVEGTAAGGKGWR